MKNLQDLSVIIPIGPSETAWKELTMDLRQLPSGAEVIFSAPFSEPRQDSEYIEFKYGRKWFRGEPTVRWVESAAGRATQMNAGARATQKKFIWFLHSDSRIDYTAISKLDVALEKRPDDLHYFDLKFSADGPKELKINEIGVKFRSRVLKIPFGDQGLCIKRTLFFRIGGYSESLIFGEDHSFVWGARQNRIRLNAVGETIETSSRKYIQGGWKATTFTHVKLTFQQAFPQWWKLQKTRFARWMQLIFHKPRSISDRSNDRGGR